MKIVIHIPEEVFDEIYNENYYSLKGKEALRAAVKNCTPLPKGHGRIIDENKITTISYSVEKHWIDEKTGQYYFSPSIIRGTDAPTIIEADKEGE